MRSKQMKRPIAVILLLMLVLQSVYVYAAPDEEESGTAQEEETEETIEELSEEEDETAQIDTSVAATRYSTVSETYTAPEYRGEPLVFEPADVVGDGSGQLTTDTKGYDGDEVLDMTLGDTQDFIIDVPETALYYINLDYYAYSESLLAVEMELMINDSYPFYEARQLVFESTWTKTDEVSYDRYGNELVSLPDKQYQWENKYIMDGSYRWSEPLLLELEEGENVLSFTVNEGSILIGDISLTSLDEVPAYTGSEAAEGDELITIQGEDMASTNDYSVSPTALYDINLEPYSSSTKVLNTLDGDTYKDGGQKVTYEFDVTEAGYYQIAMNYIQEDKTNFPVFLDIEIDGELQSDIYKDYPMDYEKTYTVKSLTDADGDYVSTWLEAGTHTISFTISMDPIRGYLEEIERIMAEINDLSLDVITLAGTNKDKYRDINISDYIPDVEEQLNGWADTLESIHEDARQYTDASTIGAMSSIDVAISQLRSLAEEPNRLPYRVGELSQDVSCVTSFLAAVIDSMNKNNIAIDRIYIYQSDAELPQAAGLAKRISASVVRFFASYSNDTYSTAATDSEHLQVWVNRSTQYLDVMQKMIDEYFTPETGIEVDLSLMPDQNKLVLANASGDAPDIATGINYAIPFDLGIRGAVKDLTEFDDFSEIASQYPSGLLVPSTIGDGIYSLPETMNFYVLYYRSDVFENLGLEVPDTMDDVIELLPQLQMRGLNFFYPTSGMLAMRNFHGTTPLLFQHDASLYGEYAGDTTLNSEEGIAGFTYLTELYTIYNLPVDVPSFYQHFRNGDLPIGISDYGMYNLLTNAAPELESSWEIALVPGIEGEDGEVKRYTSGGAESTVMFESTSEREEMAWEFMKWWSSAEVQAEYGQRLQMSYGDEYIWSTANTEAFAQLPWSTKDKEVIQEQMQWIQETPRVLGSYMVEREISNAYNSIVVDGENLRETVDDAVKRIDRETQRKLEEFGYMDSDGNVLEEYLVPTIEIVERILESDD